MTSPPEYPQDTALAEPEDGEPTYPLCFRGPTEIRRPGMEAEAQ